MACTSSSVHAMHGWCRRAVKCGGSVVGLLYFHGSVPSRGVERDIACARIFVDSGFRSVCRIRALHEGTLGGLMH